MLFERMFAIILLILMSVDSAETCSSEVARLMSVRIDLGIISILRLG